MLTSANIITSTVQPLYNLSSDTGNIMNDKTVWQKIQFHIAWAQVFGDYFAIGRKDKFERLTRISRVEQKREVLKLT